MRHYLALVACLVLTGSVAQAAPGRSAGRHGKVSQQASKKAGKKASKKANKKAKRVRTVHAREEAAREEAPREEAPRDSGRIALRSEAADDEDIIDLQDDPADRAEPDPPVRLRKAAKPARAKDWHVAIGPYLWASSVDADISLGPASVSSGVDFFDVQRHARYGAEVLAEVRYGRFSIYGDFLYGVVAVDGAKEVGPLMVKLNGSASSLHLDGAAGYLLAGGPQSRLSLEALAGVRYQRTAISGSVNVAGAEVSPSEQVDAAADALAGAKLVVRPLRRLALSGTFDLGVVGASTNTWSATADASVRVSKYVLISLGYRTLTTERTNLSIVMHGPRAAVQLMF